MILVSHYLDIVSNEQTDMETSGDNLPLEKIDSISHPEESMDFEYEVFEVYEA
jgi:transcription initiation factor TFIID subunit 1